MVRRLTAAPKVEERITDSGAAVCHVITTCHVIGFLFHLFVTVSSMMEQESLVYESLEREEVIFLPSGVTFKRESLSQA